MSTTIQSKTAQKLFSQKLTNAIQDFCGTIIQRLALFASPSNHVGCANTLTSG